MAEVSCISDALDYIQERVANYAVRALGAEAENKLMDAYIGRLEAVNADLLKSLQDMILMTHRGSVTYLLSTEQEVVLAKAEAVVARVKGVA